MTGAATDPTTLWFRRYGRGATPRHRLICFAHVGGGPQAFRGWPDAMPPDAEVVAVRYPGRQDRLAEACAERLDVLADSIAEACGPLLDVPTSLFGHSMGAWLAYEVALRLQRRYGFVPGVLFASGQRSPHASRRRRPAPRNDDDLITEVRRLGAYEPEIFESPELRELVMPAIRADFRMVREYRPSTGTIAAPVVGYGGDADPDVSTADLRAWAEVTEAGFAHRVLPGDHFFLVDGEAELLRDLASRLPRV